MRRVHLLVTDQHYFDQPPISTVTFFHGTLPRRSFTERVQGVLNANPWLAGRLDGKALAVPETPSIGDHLAFVQNEALTADKPLSTLEALTAPLLAPSGQAAAAAPLWRVTVVESAPERFALVISLSHVLADGYTYYAIYHQLSVAGDAADQLGADTTDAHAPPTALLAERLDDFGMMLACATRRRTDWPLCDTAPRIETISYKAGRHTVPHTPRTKHATLCLK